MNRYTATAINQSGAVLTRFDGNNKRELISTIRRIYSAPFKIRIDDNKLELIGAQTVEVKR